MGNNLLRKKRRFTTVSAGHCHNGIAVRGGHCAITAPDSAKMAAFVEAAARRLLAGSVQATGTAELSLAKA